jgi:hypothetical protein
MYLPPAPLLFSFQAVFNGTVAELEKEFNISSDGFPCHETTSSSTDSVLVDMVTGVYIFSGLFIMAGLVMGIVGKLPHPPRTIF